jgi:hypothetical protein
VHLSHDSTKALDDLRHDLERACASHGLDVVEVTDAGPRLAEAGSPPARRSFVLELRDPLPALEGDAGRAAGTTWRVAGYEKPGGGTRVSTMRPTELVNLIGHPELAAAAARVERSLDAALAEAARER